MGKTTLTAYTCGFKQDGEKVWTKYTEIGRSSERDATPYYNKYFADTTHKTGEEADYATWQLNNYWCTLNADDTPKNPPKKKTLTNTAALSGDGGAQAAEAVETAGSAQPMDARACTAEAAAIVVVNNTMATNPSDGVWGGQPARKYRR